MRRFIDMEKAPSLTELTVDAAAHPPEVLTPAEDQRPMEIALVPIASFEGSSSTPRFRGLRSKLSFEDGAGLKHLRSLRSTLSAAVDSFRLNRDVMDNHSSEAGDPLEGTTHKEPGPVWVRGCSCEVSTRLASRYALKVSW